MNEPDDHASADSQMIAEMADALAQNRKVEAIKIYREAKGATLLEAKQFVEELIPQLAEKDPERFAQLKTAGSGCGGAAAAILFIVTYCIAAVASS